MERVSVAAPGARVGYTRASMASLLRDFRAGKVQMFAPPGRPGPKSAPAKDRARARVVQLRREGLSVHEISSRLRAEATPLNRTGVGQILAEEGFGRLVRGRELISWTDRPSRRSCTTRARARSLAGALFGPGRAGGVNICTLPARNSRSRLAMPARV